VDAAQSLGAIDAATAAPAADIYAFTGHKWCCGPEGLGGVAVPERLLEQALPTLIRLAQPGATRSRSDQRLPSRCPPV
jgi:L-cysteine/cystine lyase